MVTPFEEQLRDYKWREKISLTPIFWAVELGFLFVLARRTSHLAPAEENMGPVYVLLLWVSTYSILISILGARGVYTSEELLKFLPGLWPQLITVAAIVLPVILFDGVRNGIRRMIDTTPWKWSSQGKEGYHACVH